LFDEKPYNGDGYSGIIQGMQDGEWKSACDGGSIADPNYHNNIAEVFCRQLSAKSTKEYPHAYATAEYVTNGPNDKFWTNDIKCNGDEDSIDKCVHSYDDTCSAGGHLKVFCTGTEKLDWRFTEVEANDGEITGGFRGFVEKWRDADQTWRRICDHDLALYHNYE
jgi:hypothetical protein